jgi:ABC-type glycerol-3-phosphate transport system permease component
MRRKRSKGLKIAGKVIIFVVIAVVFVAYVFPIFWMGVSSFKTKVQIFDPARSGPGEQAPPRRS